MACRPDPGGGQAVRRQDWHGTAVERIGSTALAVVQAAGHEPRTVQVLPTNLFDRRRGLHPVRELLSVTQVAEALGVSRSAVAALVNEILHPALEPAGVVLIGSALRSNSSASVSALSTILTALATS